jgi:hypothetical protein
MEVFLQVHLKGRPTLPTYPQFHYSNKLPILTRIPHRWITSSKLSSRRRKHARSRLEERDCHAGIVSQHEDLMRTYILTVAAAYRMEEAKMYTILNRGWTDDCNVLRERRER